MRAALERVLSSTLLARSPRQARLLRYVCERAVLGLLGDLKEHTIAVDVFDRPVSFNLTPDSVVRVEMHRLRKRLERYYVSEGKDDPVRILLPVGQYPEFVCTAAPAGAGSEPDNWSRAAVIPAVLGVLVVAMLCAALLRSRLGSTPAARVTKAVSPAPHETAAIRILAGY